MTKMTYFLRIEMAATCLL